MRTHILREIQRLSYSLTLDEIVSFLQRFRFFIQAIYNLLSKQLIIKKLLRYIFLELLMMYITPFRIILTRKEQ